MQPSKAISEPSVVPIWRADGTVYFEVQQPLSERLCDWAVVVLWIGVFGAALAVVLWR
jgi:hypothetical protein